MGMVSWLKILGVIAVVVAWFAWDDYSRQRGVTEQWTAPRPNATLLANYTHGCTVSACGAKALRQCNTASARIKAVRDEGVSDSEEADVGDVVRYVDYLCQTLRSGKGLEPQPAPMNEPPDFLNRLAAAAS